MGMLGRVAGATLNLRGWGGVLLGVVCLVALLATVRPAEAAPTLPPGFQDELVTPIDRPTGVAFVPGGRILIARVPGVVRMFKNGSLDPVATPALNISAKTCSDGERGLMSVAVDPQFESNHYVYLYYTFKNNGSTCPTGSSTTPVNRVSRFVLGDNDLIDPASEFVLIDNIPAPEQYHIGADLRFGKDGYLYISTGDGGCDWQGGGCLSANDASRDQHVLLGKVLRVTRDGAIPPSNPYQGAGTARCNVTGRTTAPNKCQETYAWGLRNPYRLATDMNASGTRVFINDVGEITWEEIDELASGADYGWNVREGFCATDSDTDCGPPPAGMTNPIHAYHHDTGCTTITGGTFIPKGLWPAEYDDDYIYADFTCGKMFRLSPNGTGGYDEIEFGTGFPEFGVVAATFSAFQPKNGLYYAHWGSTLELHRIVYNGADRAGYARPKAAGRVRVTLVPAFNACTASNRTHGPPLVFPSCNPPVQSSSNLTIGTPDANGAAVNSNGFVRLTAAVGTPGGADDADAGIQVSISDVRRTTTGLPDYTGELQLRLPLRLTDKINGGPAGFEQGTLQDRNFDATVPCTGTVDTSIGSTCSITTTADAIVPGVVVESKRTVWELGKIQVLDGGSDGVASTAPNSPFASQGVMVP
jgi:glucose/arabinose dehydrogenase